MNKAKWIWDRGWMPLPLTSRGVPGVSWKSVMDQRCALTYRRWKQEGWTSWGVVTGPEIVVLDCDTDRAVRKALRRGIPETFTVRTRRGKHFYFRGGIDVPTFKIWPDADLKGMRGMVKLFDGEKTIERDVEVAEMPAWLKREIKVYQRKAKRRARERERRLSRVQGSKGARAIMRRLLRGLLSAREGQRNIRLNMVAWELAPMIDRDLLSHGEVYSALFDAGLEIGLSEREVLKTLKSAGIDPA